MRSFLVDVVLVLALWALLFSPAPAKAAAIPPPRPQVELSYPYTFSIPCQYLDDMITILDNQKWELEGIWVSLVQDGQCAVSAFRPAA